MMRDPFSSTETHAEPHTVAVLAFDGISPFHLSVPCIVFGPDMQGEGVPPFRLRVCSAERGRLRTTAGFHLEATHGLMALARADTVIVPSWRDVEERPPEAVLRALRRAHERGARIVGLCLGAFVLAEAGLLDGRSATTHWHLTRQLAERYPQVVVQPDVLYVDDGPVLTSAGTAAAIDCCLHLLRTQFGAEVANRVARRMVVAPHRQGGQAQYIQQPLPAAASTGGDRLATVLAWAQRHLNEALSLDALAERAVMSRRTFTRQFRQRTGTTVGQWLLNQRLALAQRLLETSDRTVEAVAADAGFGSAASLRLHFASVLHTSPSDYRRQFRGGV